MRAISNRPLQLTLEAAEEEADPYNPRRHIITKPRLKAIFTKDTTEKENELAKSYFKFNGLPLEEDSGMPIDPSYRICAFDTTLQNYDEETRLKVEDILTNSPWNGSDFIIVEEVKLPAPWAGYDNLRSVKKILELVVETGSDAEDVLEYEKENKNRSEVVEALQAVLSPPADADAVVVSA